MDAEARRRAEELYDRLLRSTSPSQDIDMMAAAIADAMAQAVQEERDWQALRREPAWTDRQSGISMTLDGGEDDGR